MFVLMQTFRHCDAYYQTQITYRAHLINSYFKCVWERMEIRGIANERERKGLSLHQEGK